MRGARGSGFSAGDWQKEESPETPRLDWQSGATDFPDAEARPGIRRKPEPETAGSKSWQGKRSSKAREAPRLDRAAATKTLVSRTTRIAMRNYPVACVSARMPQVRIRGIALSETRRALSIPVTFLSHLSFCILSSKLNPPVPLCLREMIKFGSSGG